METKGTFTPLTKGRATWTGELEVDLYIDTGDEGTRILPILEPEDVFVSNAVSSKVTCRTRSAGGQQAKQCHVTAEGELALPKTYLTRKGAMLLFTAPENVELTSEHRNLIRKGLMKSKNSMMKEKFGTLEKFARSVLEFGNEEIHENHSKSADAFCLKFVHGTEDFKATDWRLKPGGDLSSYLRSLKARTAGTTQTTYEHVYPPEVTNVQLNSVPYDLEEEEEDDVEPSHPAEVVQPEADRLHVQYAAHQTRPVSAPEPAFRRRIGSGLLPRRKLSAEILASNLRSTSYLGRPSSSDRVSSGGKYARLRDDPFSNTPSTRPNSPSTRPNTPSTRPSSVKSRPGSSRSRRSSFAAMETHTENLTPMNESAPKPNELSHGWLQVDGTTVKEHFDDVTSGTLINEQGAEFSDEGSEVQISPDGGINAVEIGYDNGPKGYYGDKLDDDISASLPRVRILSPVESVPSEDLDELNSDYEADQEPVISVEIRSGMSSVASSHSGIPSRPVSAAKETPAPHCHSLTSDVPIGIGVNREPTFVNSNHQTPPSNQETLDLPINQDNNSSDSPINQETLVEPHAVPDTPFNDPIPDLNKNSNIVSPEYPKSRVVGVDILPTDRPPSGKKVNQSVLAEVHKGNKNVLPLSTTGTSDGKTAAAKQEELATQLKAGRTENSHTASQQITSITGIPSKDQGHPEKKENLASQTSKELERLFGPKPPKSPPKKVKESQTRKNRKHKSKKTESSKPVKDAKPVGESKTDLENTHLGEAKLPVPEIRTGEDLEKTTQDDKHGPGAPNSKDTHQFAKDEGKKDDEAETDDEEYDKPGSLTLADLEMEHNVFRGRVKTLVEADESEEEDEDDEFEVEDDEEEGIKEKYPRKKKPVKKEKKVLSEEEMKKIEEEKASQRKEREEAKQRKLKEMIELQQKIKDKEEEMQKQEEQAMERKKKLEEDIEKIAAEAELAKQAEQAARKKLAAQRKAAKEEREAKRRIELDKKKAEAALKRDRERKISEDARLREGVMLNNISGGRRLGLLQQDEERRKEELEEERLVKAAIDEEEHLSMLDMLAEEQAMSHLVAGRRNAEEMQRALEEEAYRMRISEEQERQHILKEQQKLDEIQRQREDEERQRQEEEKRRLKELERLEEEKRENLKLQAFQRRQMLLVRRDQNLDRRKHLESLQEEQGVTRPWIFSYYVQWPMETYEKLMCNEDGKKPSSGKKGGRGKSGKKGKGKKGKKGKKKK